MRRGSIAAALLLLLALHGCAYPAAKRAQGWTLVETEHIRLRTPLSRDRASAIAREMQRVRDVVAGTVVRCPVLADDDEIAVTVLPDRRFEEVAGKGLSGFHDPSGMGWLGDQAGAIVMEDDVDQRARQVFQHELSHRLMDLCLPRAPAWLDEGMASLVETAIVEQGKVDVGRAPYFLGDPGTQLRSGLHRGVVVRFLERRLLTRVKDLLRVRRLAEGTTRRGRLRAVANYGAAWALVHMLLLGDRELRPRFIAFQRDLLGGDEHPIDLFLRHFDVEVVQARLDAYVARGWFPHAYHPIQVPARPAPRLRPMTSGEAHLHWAWLWSRTPSDEARERWREHLDAAMRDADMRADAHVLRAMILIEEQEGRARAEREIDAGLELDPDAPGLLHAKVDLLLARGADPSAPAGRLRRVARGPQQLCALAHADLAAGRARQALALAAAALERRPSSARCRLVVDQARAAIARAPGA